MNDERIMTKKEVAQFMQCTTRTVETRMKAGLPHYKLSERQTRFKLSDVVQWMESKCKVIRMG